VLLKHQRRVVLRYARAVIRHTNLTDTAACNADADGTGTCIDRIFHQFLDDAERPLNDLASGYFIRHAF